MVVDNSNNVAVDPSANPADQQTTANNQSQISNVVYPSQITAQTYPVVNSHLVFASHQGPVMPSATSASAIPFQTGNAGVDAMLSQPSWTKVENPEGVSEGVLVYRHNETGRMLYLGTEGDDKITASSGDDIILSFGGNDKIDGGDGNDFIAGGKGNDEINAGAGDDVVQGNDGDDVIEGQVGQDYLLGQKGNDTIRGGEGSDTVVGGEGEDSLESNDEDTVIQESLAAGQSSQSLPSGQPSTTPISPDVQQAVTSSDTVVTGGDASLVNQGSNVVHNSSATSQVGPTTEQAVANQLGVGSANSVEGYPHTPVSPANQSVSLGSGVVYNSNPSVSANNITINNLGANNFNPSAFDTGLGPIGYGYRSPFVVPSVPTMNLQLAGLAPIGVSPIQVQSLQQLALNHAGITLPSQISDLQVLQLMSNQALGLSAGMQSPVAMPGYPSGFVYGTSPFMDGLVHDITLAHCYCPQHYGVGSLGQVATLDLHGALYRAQQSFTLGFIQGYMQALNDFIEMRVSQTPNLYTEPYPVEPLQSVASLTPYQLSTLTDPSTGRLDMLAFQNIAGTLASSA